MKIDLGAIGKGYAIDRAIAVLKKKGIKKALVNAGGNIFYLDEDYSRIGIKNPLKTDEVIATVSFRNKAISTSANYERFFNIEGKKYGHLIDTKTGYPVSNNILSASIISPSAKLSDAVSTAVFILGLKEGMKLIESIDDLEGIIIAKIGRKLKLYASSGLSEIYPSTYFLN